MIVVYVGDFYYCVKQFLYWILVFYEEVNKFFKLLRMLLYVCVYCLCVFDRYKILNVSQYIDYVIIYVFDLN